MRKHRDRTAFLLSVILSAGLILRLYQLAARDLWFDEVCSIYKARDLITYLAVDMTPPLYYVFLSFWTHIFGDSAFQARLISVIFGTASIVLLYKLGKLLFKNKEVGLASALILAISPIHLWYSQEARGYTFAVFAVMLTAYFFIQAVEEKKKIYWIAFTAASTASLYSSYYYLPVILSEMAILLLIKRYRVAIKHWLISLVITGAAFLPFLGVFFYHLKSVKNNFWINPPTIKSLFFSFGNFNVGYNASEITYALSALFFLGLFLLGASQAAKKHKNSLVILLSLWLLPVLAVFVVSKVIPIYIDRHLILYLPFYAVVIASGIALGVRKRRVKIMLVLLLVILTLPALGNYFSGLMPAAADRYTGTYIKKPFGPAVNYVKMNYQKDDAIIHTNHATTVTFEYYWSRDSLAPTYPFAASHFFMLAENDKYWQGVVQERFAHCPAEINKELEIERNIRSRKFKRIWLISSTWNRAQGEDENSTEVKKILAKNYKAIIFKEFDGIFVTLWVLARPVLKS